MPDDNASGSVKEQSAQQNPGCEADNPPPSPDAPKSQPAKSDSSQEIKRDVKDLEDRVKTAERYMIGLTFAIALFALGGVIVGIFQWSAMSGQLGEMKTGGKDTHDLAIAAGIQAAAAKSSAETAREQLRPWVSAKLSIQHPLTFNAKGGTMTIKALLRNPGHSAAIHVRFKSELIAVMGNNLVGSLKTQQANLCDPYRTGTKQGVLIGNILFPGDQIEVSEMMNLPEAEIQSALSASVEKGFISPVVIACADYQFSASSEHHQTRYAFPLSKGRPDFQGGWKGFFEPSGAPVGVTLVRFLMGEYVD